MLRRLLGREPGTPPGPPPGADDDDEVARLRASLDALITRTHRAAGRLPMGVVPAVRAIADRLVELLDHAQATHGSSVSAAERQSLSATIEDYLPSSVDAYLALPASFAQTHVGRTGKSPGHELVEQLALLDVAVRDLAVAVYSGDAERLSTQGRFLDTKFARTDLELS